MPGRKERFKSDMIVRPGVQISSAEQPGAGDQDEPVESYTAGNPSLLLCMRYAHFVRNCSNRHGYVSPWIYCPTHQSLVLVLQYYNSSVWHSTRLCARPYSTRALH